MNKVLEYTYGTYCDQKCSETAGQRLPRLLGTYVVYESWGSFLPVTFWGNRYLSKSGLVDSGDGIDWVVNARTRVFPHCTCHRLTSLAPCSRLTPDGSCHPRFITVTFGRQPSKTPCLLSTCICRIYIYHVNPPRSLDCLTYKYDCFVSSVQAQCHPVPDNHPRIDSRPSTRVAAPR